MRAMPSSATSPACSARPRKGYPSRPTRAAGPTYNRQAGTLDLGVESINAKRITILDRIVIRRDQTSGAETEILRLETEERYKPLALDRALRILGEDARPIVNCKSGKAAIRCSTYSLTDDDGEIVRRYELVRPTRSERKRQDLLVETMWEEASEEEFAALWQAEVEEMSGKTRTSTLYLVTGLLLPVWDRLPDDHVQVWRLNTDVGQSFLGRIVPAQLVSKLADAFGIAAMLPSACPRSGRQWMPSLMRR